MRGTDLADPEGNVSSKNLVSARDRAGTKGPYHSGLEMVRLPVLACKGEKPERVIETGVARGASSQAILQALEENRKGHLYSIDMPNVNAKYRSQKAAPISCT